MPKPKRKVQFLEGEEGKDLDEVYERLIKEGAIAEAAYALPRGYLSWSQVGSYLRCPRAYQLRYIDGLIIPPPARMVEGKAVHRGLEVGHNSLMKSGKVPPLDIFLDSWNDSWKAISKEIIDWGGETSRIIQERDRIFLTDYHTTRVPKLRPVAVEKRFFTMLGKIPVLGFVDLINEEGGKKIVTDAKVVSRSKSQADTDTDGQLTVYSYVSASKHVRHDCFIKLKTKPTIKTIDSTRSAADHAWITHVFQEVAKAISSGVFPPTNPSDYSCSPKYCGFYEVCRRGNGST